MKRLWALGFVFLLAGCVQVDVTLDVNKQREGTLTTEVMLNKSMMEMFGAKEQQQQVLSEFENNFDTIEEKETKSSKGFVAIKDLGTIEVDNIRRGELGTFSEYVVMKKEENFFFDTYSFTVDAKQLLAKEIDDSLLGLIGDGIDVNVTTNLPVPLAGTNATKVKEGDGVYSYQWKMTASKLGEIEGEVKLPNFRRIILSVSGLFVVLLSIRILLKRRKSMR